MANFANADFTSGLGCLATDDFVKAIEHFQSAGRSTSDESVKGKCHLHCGLAFQKMRDFPAADNKFRLALTCDPSASMKDEIAEIKSMRDSSNIPQREPVKADAHEVGGPGGGAHDSSSNNNINIHIGVPPNRQTDDEDRDRRRQAAQDEDRPRQKVEVERTCQVDAQEIERILRENEELQKKVAQAEESRPQGSEQVIGHYDSAKASNIPVIASEGTARCGERWRQAAQDDKVAQAEESRARCGNERWRQAAQDEVVEDWQRLKVERKRHADAQDTQRVLREHAENPQRKIAQGEESRQRYGESRHEQDMLNQIHGDEEYMPLVSFVDCPPADMDQDFESCAIDLAPVLPDLKFFDRLIKFTQTFAFKRRDSMAAKTINDMNMVFAIFLFTMDLSLVCVPGQYETKNNFYFQFNEMLRKRNGQFLALGHKYLYLLMTGLFRLPPQTGSVYRGIGPTKARAVLDRFKQGQRVHFSATSSTTVSRAVAETFSQGGGVMLHFHLLDDHSQSRDISGISAFKEEQEVLLLPNFKCSVGVVSPQDSCTIIEFWEERSDEIKIDFD